MEKKTRGQDQGSTEGGLPNIKTVERSDKERNAKKYNKLPKPEVLGTAKQRLVALYSCLKSQEYKKDVLHSTHYGTEQPLGISSKISSCMPGVNDTVID